MSGSGFNVLFLVLLTGLLAGVASAIPGNYAPFTPDHWPATFPLRQLEVDPISEESFVVPVNDATRTEIRLSSDPEGAIFAELLSGGRIQFSKKEISPVGVLQFVEAYTSDLNQDGKPDYVIACSCGGCGLNAGLSMVAFLLSTRHGYELCCTESYEFSPLDFIMVGGTPRFMNACLKGVDECLDGKSHSFWVYNLYAFDQGILKVDNSRMPDFPKVIWFSHSPNHQESTLLTPKQKATLIKPDP